MTLTVQSGVQVGEKAPDFMLPDQHGKPIRLADFAGKTAVVLYFYPKDNTAGCTLEACTFRDSYEAFQQAGATVIGVSVDSPESHQGFAEKHRLPFILLSDQNGQVHKLYEITNFLGIIRGRETFVIDKDGIIRHRFASAVNMTKHVSEALRVLQALPQA